MTARQQTLVGSFAAYALVVCGLWAYDGLYAGFYSETGLIYPSDTQDWWSGFFYVDPLRKFTSTFYHLSYLIGTGLGQQGSYVPYQVVYALLWFGRAALVFLIVREFFPDRLLLASLAGLATAMHTGDGSLNWIGQLNQHGFIFCMVLGFYFYVRALKAGSLVACATWAGGAMFSIYISLWAYESPLPVVPTFAVVAILLIRPVLQRTLVATSLLAAPVAVFLALNAVRYLSAVGDNTYQNTVLRKSFSLSGLSSDLIFHSRQSVAFWDWPNASWNGDAATWLAFGAVTIAALLCIPVAARAEPSPRLDGRFVLFLLGTAALIVASYLVYILIGGNRNLWRTEFLASVPAGMMIGGLIYVMSALMPRLAARTTAIVAVVLSIGIVSAAAGANTARLHRIYWEQARVMIASLLVQVPHAEAGTLFVMRGTPRQAKIFGHNFWFDLAVKVAYPGSPQIAGAFYLDDGSAAPGTAIVPARNVIEMLFNPKSGTVQVVGGCRPGTPSPIAINRYRIAEGEYAWLCNLLSPQGAM
jgi:hypothetical protein